MKILSVNRAAVAPLTTLDGQVVPSAIGKRAVVGPVAVGPLGLAGDAQADPQVHGGAAKAIYAYPSEHYAFWQTVRAQAGVAAWRDPLPWGALGENLSLQGLREGQVWLGDRLCWPDCELVVTEPRQPCFKLNAALGFKHAVKLMAQSGYCGFYLAVHRPGSLTAGDAFQVVPGPREVSIAEHFRMSMRGG